VGELQKYDPELSGCFAALVDYSKSVGDKRDHEFFCRVQGHSENLDSQIDSGCLCVFMINWTANYKHQNHGEIIRLP
jgi:hypothetical protein